MQTIQTDFRMTLCMAIRLLLLLVLSAAGLETRAALFAPATNYTVGNNPSGIWLGNLRGLGTSRDMIVANHDDDTITVRLCLDNGTFGNAAQYTVGDGPAGVRAADINKDGYGDILVANSEANTVSLLINAGVGANFYPATNFVVGQTLAPRPIAVSVADVNRDGRTDVLVANQDEDTVSLLLGAPGSSFAPVTNFAVGTAPTCVNVSDLNADGELDILTADKTAGTLTILSGNRTGTNINFVPYQTVELYPGGDPQPVYALSGDINADGLRDIAVVNFASNSVAILLADINTNFSVTATYDVGTAPRSLLLRDLNRDGILDIVTANSGDDTISVLLGVGDGTFESAGSFAVGDNPTIVVGSNFESDGATDVAVVNSDADTVSVLLFDGPLANNASISLNEDSTASFILRGSNQSGSPLQYVLLDCPTNGTLNVSCPSTLLSSNVIYTPGTNFFGVDSFRFQTTDGILTSTVATVTFTIRPVNDAPTFDLSETTITVFEGTAATNVLNFVTNIVRGPANESSQSVSFLVSTTNNFFAQKPVITSAGNLMFRPPLNNSGTVPVSVVLRDGGGTANGGTNISSTQTFNVVVIGNPLKPLQGLYNGLFFDGAGVEIQSSGFFTFTMKPLGSFTGKLTMQTGTHSLAGQFDISGHAEVIVPRTNGSLLVSLDLDLVGSSDQVTGSVTATNWSATLSGDRAVFGTTNPCPYVGRHTMAFEGSTNAALAPAGYSYGALSVSTNGTVVVSGKLAERTSFSQSTRISKNGQWPFYRRNYSGNGLVMGWLSFVTNELSHSIEGDVTWIRPPHSGVYYPDGFSLTGALTGSTYTAPGVEERALSITNGVMLYDGGNLLSPLVQNVNYTSTNLVVLPTGAIILRLNTTTGVMTGNFRDPSINRGRSLYGVVLQQLNVAQGFFRGTNESGSFLLQAE